MSYLYHSAKGTHWSKKDHKYVKKENGKYYYKDDVKQKQINEKDQRSEAEMLEAQATKETEDYLKGLGYSPSDPQWEGVYDIYRNQRLASLYKAKGKVPPQEAEREKARRKESAQQNRLKDADPGQTVMRRFKLDGSSPDATRWSEFLAKKNKEKVVKQTIKDIKSSKSVREGLDILKNATKKTMSKKVTLSLDDRAKQMASQEMEKNNYPKSPDFFNSLYDNYKKQLIEEERKKK